MATDVEIANDGCFAEQRDPGAAPYGNFINYYSFNPPENRLSLIPTTLLQDIGHGTNKSGTKLILDVGCNSGDLSVALYRHLLQEKLVTENTSERVHLLGVDIDKDLILRAQTSNPFPDNITFTDLDITHDQTSCKLLEAYLEKFESSHFLLCSCFAVTMWVHLNQGDAGLLDFLSHLASFSQYLLLEAQPWKCYRSAARRLRKLGRKDFDHFKTLKIRGDMAQHAREHLEKHCCMELVQNFGNTTWDRTLQLFRRR